MMAETGLARAEILARLRTGALAARDDVVGVIVFGSFARGTRYHDVDVLVVLERLAPGREAWARALHALRWQFPVAYRAETLLSPISNREGDPEP
jgi:predicted nucleotidyltransferase